MAALLALAANTKGQSFLSDGLLAYYPFSGNAIDAAGNGHDGVVMDALLTTNRFGQPDSAYAFDGTNSMIVVSNSADLQPLGDFSVSVWAEVLVAPVDNYLPNHYSMMLTKHFDGNNNSGWTMSVVPPDAVTPPSTGLPLIFQAAPQFNGSTPQMNIPTDTWFQAVFTYQRSSGTCNFYINGVLVDSRVQYFFANNDSDPFIIGALPTYTYNAASGYYYHFNGLLDDIRIYSRALSNNEVQQLYTVEAGPPVQPQVDTRKAIHLKFSQLTVGAQYQLQFSRGRNHWIDVGAPFTAKATCQSEYVDADHFDAHDVSWRLRVAP